MSELDTENSGNFVRKPGTAASGEEQDSRFNVDSSLQTIFSLVVLLQSVTDKLNSVGEHVSDRLLVLQSKLDTVVSLIDDMIAIPGAKVTFLRSRLPEDLVQDLEATQAILKRYDDELTQSSCVFGPANFLLRAWMGPAFQPSNADIRQLENTFQYMLVLDEILTSKLSVLRWDLQNASAAPKDVTFNLEGSQGDAGSLNPDLEELENSGSTFCLCCSDEPQDLKKERMERKKQIERILEKKPKKSTDEAEDKEQDATPEMHDDEQEYLQEKEADE